MYKTIAGNGDTASSMVVMLEKFFGRPRIAP
jgi:hypothetical protein